MSPGTTRLARALPALGIVAIGLLAAAPLFTARMPTGHDAIEHAMRTAEYARALASGVWWPQWSPNLGHGYGEPVFLFNPPLLYILASVPTLIGLPVVSAVNLTCAFLLVIGGLGVYAWCARVFGTAGGLVAATAYVWAPYVLLDLYVRQALTELTAVCLVPWALWGLSRVSLAPSSRRLALAAMTVGLLLLSSTPATIVTAPALLGQVFVFADRRRPLSIAPGLAALVLGALLAALFWVPAASERHLLRFDRLLTGAPAYYNHFVEPWQLWSTAWGYGNSVPGPRDRMGFGLGTVHLGLAACGVAVLAFRRVRGPVGLLGWLAVGLIGLGSVLAMEPSAPLWEGARELKYLQFPWRFLLLPTLGCAVLAAVPSAELARRQPRASVALAVGCAALLVVGGWTRARPRDLVTQPEAAFAPAGVAARDRGRGTAYEYETIWTGGRPAEPPAERLVVTAGSANAEDLGGHAHAQRFAVTAWNRARLRLNTFYFPGWRVWVDGQEHDVDYANVSGLIEFVVERGEHLVEARFEPTGARWLGRSLSLVGLALLLLLVVSPGRRGRAGSPRTAAAA